VDWGCPIAADSGMHRHKVRNLRVRLLQLLMRCVQNPRRMVALVPTLLLLLLLPRL
jgi:hypothetical protein